MASGPAWLGFLNCSFVDSAVCRPNDWANALDWNPSVGCNGEDERAQMVKKTHMCQVRAGLPLPQDFLTCPSLMDEGKVWL